MVWEDYRGNANAGTLYTGPAGWPSFGNFGPGDPVTNLRTIASNPANAIRVGNSTNINFLSNTQQCNFTVSPTSAACGLQVMGRVSYALIRFPSAGSYTLSVAHDDNVDVDLSSDYANTSYRTASYNIPVGAVGSYTASEETYATLGTFTAAAANSCALVRMYWTNAGGLNFARLRWTRPGPVTEVIPAAQMLDPGVAASAVGCNGSVSGNTTAVTLNKVLGSPRAQAADQFTVEIATTAVAGTVSQATTSGSSTGQQASTGAYPAVTGSTYYLRDLMAAGSASTLASAYTATIACTRNGIAFTPAGASPTWNVTTAASDQVVCNITNTARPILRLQKSLPAGRVLAADQFALAIAGTSAGAGASVTTTGTTNAPTEAALVSPATAGSAYSFTETAAAGANLANYTTSYACTNTLPGGQAPSGSAANFSVTPVAGDNLTCTFSNQAARPTVTLRKTTLGGVGGPFNFTLTNTVQAAGTVTTTVIGTPLQVDGDTATAGLQPFTLTTAATQVVITEAAPPAGYALTAAACTGMAGTGTAIADLPNRTITLNAAATAAGAGIVCTFTNTLVAPVFDFCTANTIYNIDQSGTTQRAYRFNTASPPEVALPTLNATVTNATEFNGLMIDPVRNRLISVARIGASSQLWAYDPANGGWYAASPTFAQSIPRAGMNASGIGYLITGGITPTVLRVDPSGTFNYTVSVVGTLTYNATPTDAGSGDLAFDSTGQGWMAVGQDLWTIDFGTSPLVANRVQRPTLGGAPLSFGLAGIAFGSNGALYVANVGPAPASSYYAVDLDAGTMTLAGSATSARDLASCAFPALAPAVLSLQKTLATVNGAPYVAGAAVRPGDTLNYQIVISHTGGDLAATLYAGDVVETLPANTTVVTAGNSFTCTGSTCPSTAGATIPAGGSITLNFVVQVNATLPAGTTGIVNAVVVNGEPGVDCAVNDCGETTGIVAPTIRLAKALPAGRVQDGDQFALLIAGTGGPAQVTTTGTGTTATGVALVSAATAGATYTLSESAAGTTSLANYTTTWACTNAVSGGQVPSGSSTSFSLTPVAGDDLTCSFSNALQTVPQPSAFTCSVGDFYQVRAAPNTNNSIFSIVDRTQNPYALANPYTVTDARLNSMGYNVNDNYLYGLNSPTDGPGGGLVRLGTTGVGDLNGAAAGTSVPVAGLPALSSLNAGEVDLQDNLFITPGIGAGASGLFRIRGITGNFPSPVAVQVTTAPDGGPPSGFAPAALPNSIGDFSLNPGESNAGLTVLYGMSGSTLYRIAIANPSGASPAASVSSRATTLPGGFGVGATYFDAPGTLYVYGNTAGPTEGFASIDIATGIASNVSAAPTTSRSDGARCPTAPAAIPPRITLNKVTTGSQGGPFTFTLTNTARSDGSVTTTNTTPTQVDGDATNAGTQPYTVSAFNTAVVITEASLPAGWSLTSVACTDNGVGVGSLSGNAYTLPAASMTSGKQFVCTFTNAPVNADLGITKTNAVGEVTAGSSTSYSLVISNAGPAAANGAVIRDPATAGLSCTTDPTCTTTGGATCPASLAILDLQGAGGLVIPILPAVASVTLTLVCTVTATGQ